MQPEKIWPAPHELEADFFLENHNELIEVSMLNRRECGALENKSILCRIQAENRDARAFPFTDQLREISTNSRLHLLDVTADRDSAVVERDVYFFDSCCRLSLLYLHAIARLTMFNPTLNGR